MVRDFCSGALALLALTAACTAQVPEGPDTAPAPLIGPADGGDAADTGCHIVLRDAHRPAAGSGYATECVAGTCWFVWEGSLDVSTEAVAEGAAPALLYQSGSDPTWYVAPATEEGGGAPGYQRFTFRFFEHTVSPGMSLTSLMRTRIQLAPYLATASGGRVFDHNRNPDPFANYLLTGDNGWSLADDPTVCPARSGPSVALTSAQVAARVEYPNVQTSVLKGVVAAPTAPGTQVTVHYQIRAGDAVVRDWTTAAASAAGDGVWEFATPAHGAPCPHYCPRHVYQFAVALTTGDHTVWDNGGGFGVDYLLASDVAGSVPTYIAPPALLDAPVELAYVQWDAAARQARGLITLLDLAYAKDVTLVYSTDGWQSLREAAASFERATSDGMEYWAFRVDVEPEAGELRFAIRYQVAGETHWDNNLGRDYRITTGAADLTSPSM